MGDKKVLIVEDDEAFCSLMRSHLGRKGYEVRSAENGLEALELLQVSPPFDVMVTDLTMPKMSGLDLLRQARKLDPRLEVIVITASNDVDSAILAMKEDGAYDYLIKPLGTFSELSLSVERAVVQRKLRLEKERLNSQLAAEASRLQALLDNTGDAILSANTQGVLTVVNPAATRLIGREGMVGCEASACLPQPLNDLINSWQALGKQGSAIVEISWPANSTQIVSLTPIADEHGWMDGWVMVVRDITHLKHLSKMKLNVLTETASKIQHPLTEAVSMVSVLCDPSSEKGDGRAMAVEHLAELLRETQLLVDDLLSMVLMEAGNSHHLTQVDLASIFDNIVHTKLENWNNDQDLALQFNLEEGLPLLRADPDVLSRLLKLMLNRAAWRSKPGGEVHLAANQHQGQVWIEVTGRPSHAEVTDQQFFLDDFLFDLGSNTQSTGFELTVIKAIVEGMGGQFWVRGRGQEGSSMAICLPTVGTMGKS
jgi:PAS domain S-box-containing protein